LKAVALYEFQNIHFNKYPGEEAQAHPSQASTL
jgi:hypothetical protein